MTQPAETPSAQREVRPLIALGAALLLAIGSAGAADRVRLAEDAPDEYIVQPGDTLWDISATFLQDPWMWPEIWQVNPEIANPHLIYPGDVIRLVWIDGRPQLVVNQDPMPEPEPDRVVVEEAEPYPTVRLSPEVRVLPLEEAIRPIPWDAIGPFLSRPSVVDKDAILQAPYVLSTQGGHLMAGADDTVYVRGTGAPEGAGFRIVQLGQEYRDPETDELLGYEAIHVGEGYITEPGDPASMFISSSSREVLEGNRLLPASSGDVDRAFQPHPPAVEVDGRIVAIVDGIASVGRYQIVVINHGEGDGLTPGDVLAVYQAGEEVEDEYEDEGQFWSGFDPEVTLPDVRAGELMVFRVAPNISYALITRSDRDIHIGDFVRNP